MYRDPSESDDGCCKPMFKVYADDECLGRPVTIAIDNWFTAAECDELQPLVSALGDEALRIIGWRSPATLAELDAAVHHFDNRPHERRASPLTLTYGEALEALLTTKRYHGTVYGLPPHNVAGVYFLLTADASWIDMSLGGQGSGVLYIGIGAPVSRRIKSHANDHHKRTAGWVRWVCFDVPISDERRAIERALIATLNPSLNIDGRTDLD